MDSYVDTGFKHGTVVQCPSYVVAKTLEVVYEGWRCSTLVIEVLKSFKELTLLWLNIPIKSVFSLHNLF